MILVQEPELHDWLMTLKFFLNFFTGAIFVVHKNEYFHIFLANCKFLPAVKPGHMSYLKHELTVRASEIPCVVAPRLPMFLQGAVKRPL